MSKASGSKATVNSLALYSSPHSEGAKEKPMTTDFHLIVPRNEIFSRTQILSAKENQSNPSLTATFTPATDKKERIGLERVSGQHRCT